jgi:hypothetical protein
MTVRVAVPLRVDGSRLEGGVSLVVAASKLLAFEFHEAALQAKENELNFDARHDEIEALVEHYLLVRGGDMDGPGLFLAGEIDMPVESVRDTKESMGHFAFDLQLFSMRPEPLVRVGNLSSDDLEQLSDEAGFDLPVDWKKRVHALQHKHMPPPVIGEYARTADPMPREYASDWPMAVAREKCSASPCDNYATAPGQTCNNCKRLRAIAAAEALAMHLSTAAGVTGSPKRARIEVESMRV